MYLWCQASRVCARTSSVHSASRQIRRVVSLSARKIGSFFTYHSFFTKDFEQISPVPLRPANSRQDASLATQDAPNLDRGAPAKPADGTPVDPATVNELPTFQSLKGSISYPTLKAITVKPFQLTHMSPVQAQVLPLLPQLAEAYDPTSSGARPPRDLLVKAKTGTGKTLAFLVPAIESRLKAIDEHGKIAVKNANLTTDKHLEGRVKRKFVREEVGTLIISPTRELATQIANEALRLTHHHDDFEVRLFVGGVSKRMQMRDWMKGRRDIVVATPGRLRDFLLSEPEVLRGIEKTKLVGIQHSAFAIR